MKMKKLIQLGHATFGEGETPEDARDDARQWLETPTDADDVPIIETMDQIYRRCKYGDLIIVSTELAEQLGDY